MIISTKKIFTILSAALIAVSMIAFTSCEFGAEEETKTETVRGTGNPNYSFSINCSPTYPGSATSLTYSSETNSYNWPNFSCSVYYPSQMSGFTLKVYCKYNNGSPVCIKTLNNQFVPSIYSDLFIIDSSDYSSVVSGNSLNNSVNGASLPFTFYVTSTKDGTTTTSASKTVTLTANRS